MFLLCRTSRIAAVLAAALAATSCGKHNDDCPGHCPVDSTHPTMTIEVAGGAAILAKAEVVSGPCSHLLVRSWSEAGAPTGYAAVQVTYNGTTTSPLPLCLVEVTTLDGQATDVTAEARVTTSQSVCCPKGSCCAQAQTIIVHQTVVFTRAVQAVAFAPLEAGLPDATIDATVDARIDATVDARIDATIDVGAQAIDATVGAEIDSESDAPMGSNDGGERVLDAAEDAATESGTAVDGGVLLDLAVEL